MHVSFVGNHRDRAQATQVLADAGVQISDGFKIGFVNFGHTPRSEMTLGEFDACLDRAKAEVDKGVTALCVDWEPTGVVWNGRNGRATGPRVIDTFAMMVEACKKLCPVVGVYGFPASNLWWPYLTETGNDAALMLHERAKPTAWFPSLYSHHTADDDLSYSQGGLAGEVLAQRLAMTLRATSERFPDTLVAPLFSGHIFKGNSPLHERRLDERDCRLWWRVVASMGVTHAGYWTDNNDDFVDEVTQHAPVIAAATADARGVREIPAASSVNP